MGLDDDHTLSRYRCGRDGDHLMGVPFECDLCSFRNVSGRDPEFGNRKDLFTLTAIRRVSLDVMWAREPATVAGNWARARADYSMVSNHLSLEAGTLLPRLGNPKLEDRVGMAVALATVCTSLRAGRNSSNIQVDTMRRTQTWYGNAHDAGSGYSCQTVVGLDQKKQYLSTSHTFGRWFSRFMRGARLRMGMVRRQNEALMSLLLLGVCAAGEEAWRQSSSEVERKTIEDTVCFMLIAFGAGLRGEEVPLVSLEGLLTFWMLTRAEPERYMMITLKGRFKGEVDSRWHVVPISDQSRSNIPFRLWMERIVYRRVKLEGREKGWLFESQPDARAKFGHYDPLFRSLIAKARDKNPRLVPAVVEGTDFSLWRSPWRGAVLETTNHGVDTKVIELVNRWRKKEAAKGSEPGLPMRQVYTQVRNTLPVMLEFSRAL